MKPEVTSKSAAMSMKHCSCYKVKLKEYIDRHFLLTEKCQTHKQAGETKKVWFRSQETFPTYSK